MSSPPLEKRPASVWSILVSPEKGANEFDFLPTNFEVVPTLRAWALTTTGIQLAPTWKFRSRTHKKQGFRSKSKPPKGYLNQYMFPTGMLRSI